MRVPARRLVIASAALACAAGAVPAYAAISTPESHVAVVSAASDGIAGQYIVTYKPGRQFARSLGFPTLHRFDNGFAARLTGDQLKKLQRDPNVAAIEQDKIMRITTTQSNPPWGLDRIDERALPLSKSYTYSHTATKVYVYVIDTGIDTSLSQFGGRAKAVYGKKSDCNGHGTHVAGIVGSKTYGVAKKVNLRSVQVLDCNGSATVSDVIAGVNYVRNHHATRSVANLSLGGAKSTALNDAITKLSKSGVFVAVAAGNDNVDACTESPASAGYVEAVGASDSSDTRADFSNFGKCVDMYAPGVGIKSTVPGGTDTWDGTSMASPFVAGVAALYKAKYGQKSFSTIQKWMSDHATLNVIKDNPSGPNRLIYKSTL